MAKGEELFAKEALNLKSLKKMDKDELISTIEINLQELVDFYYEEFHRKEEREYRSKFTDLVLSKKLFLKPLAKIIKNSDEEVPEGLAFMMYDTVTLAAKTVNDKIREIKESNIPDADKENAIKELNSEFQDAKGDVLEVVGMLVKKTAKKLKKIGFKEVYAYSIAPALFSPQYVSAKNVFRFVRTLTNCLYTTYTMSLAKNEDDEVVTTAGTDLSNPKTIASVMYLITKDMNLGDYGEFVKQILLEKRDKGFDSIGPALPVYNAITAWALAMLEDKKTFNKGTRKNVIQSFGEQRARDEKRGRDAKRRVVFSELDPDMYPNIVKAFNKVVNKDNSDDKE